MLTLLMALATVAASPANLPSALKAAQPGDVLVLDGDYPTVTLPKRSFEPRLTVNATKARVTGVVFNGTAGVNWLGGRVTQAPSGYAFRVLQSSQIAIRGAVATEAARGVIIDRSTDIVVSGVTLTGLRTDGIDVAASQRVMLASNRCSNFTPISSDHPDCIQAWTVAGYPAVSDLVIVGNSAEGSMQGIGLFDGPFERVTIVGNRVRNTYPQGIGLYAGVDSIVTQNDVASIAPLKADGRSSVKSNINLPNGLRVLACGNLVSDVKGHAAAAPC